jgi:hypothetical protein
MANNIVHHQSRFSSFVHQQVGIYTSDKLITAIHEVANAFQVAVLPFTIETVNIALTRF